MGKTLIVGDIHGCYDELIKLIELSGNPEQIISVGDIFDRGNQNVQILDYILKHNNFIVVRGNHENKHLLGYMGPNQLITKQEFDSEDSMYSYDYMRKYFINSTLPYYLDDKVIVIHAFYDWQLSLKEHVFGCCIDKGSIINDNTGILYGHLSYVSRLKEKYGDDYIWNWWRYVDFDVPLCFGHLKYDKPELIPNKVYALDGGVASMGYLHGLLLPDMKVISVKNDRFDFTNNSGFIYPEFYSNPRIFFRGTTEQMEGVFTGQFEIKRNGDLRLSKEYRESICDIYDEIIEEKEKLNVDSNIINDILQRSKKQHKIRNRLREVMASEKNRIRGRYGYDT